MKSKKILKSKYRWWMLGVSLLLISVIVVLLINARGTDDSEITTTKDVYEEIEKIKEEKLNSSPILKLYDMYDKGELPGFAGHYQDVSGGTAGVTVKIKNLNSDEVEKIKAFDEGEIFVFEDATYSMKELEDNFMLITKDSEVMRLNESVSIDVIANLIIIRTSDVERLKEALDLIEANQEMIDIVDSKE